MLALTEKFKPAGSSQPGTDTDTAGSPETARVGQVQTPRRIGDFLVENFTATHLIAIGLTYLVMIIFAVSGVLHCEQIDCFDGKSPIPHGF
jgi:hypothetical protein